MKLKLFVLFIILQGFFNLAKAESIRFRSFTIEDGLPNNTVHFITSDSLGFIWLSTSSGMARFDGHAFRSFYSPFSLSGQPLNNIQNYNNRLLSYSQSQIIAFNPRSHEWKVKVNAPISGDVSSVISDKDSILYYTVAEILCRYDPKSGKTSFRQFSESLKSVEILSAQKLALAGSDSLYLLDPVSLRIVQRLELSGIQRLHKSSRGSLLVATKNSLIEVSPDALQQRRLLHEAYSIKAIAESDQYYWIGTEDQGMLRISKEDNKFEVFNTRTAAQLNDDHITALHLDRNNHLWIGTRYGGLHILTPRNNTFLHYHPGNLQQLTRSRITGFFEDSERHILLLTPKQIFSWNTSKQSVDPIQLPVGKDLIFKTFFQSGDKIYLGTNKGIWTISPRRQLIPVLKTLSLDINALYQRRNGIWLIATNENEFIQADTLFNIRSRIVPGKMRSDDLPPNRITSILETGNGKIYLGTENGLVFYNENLLSFKVYQNTQESDLFSNIITCLYEDRSGRLWVGTEAGSLSLFNPEMESFENFGASQGFIGKSVFSIIEDMYGLLWLGTDQGLSRFDPIQKRFTQFSTSDGIQDNRFLPGSTIKLRSGELLFGGVNGFNLFHPAQFRINSKRSPVVFTSVLVNNKAYSESAAYLELKHDQNDLYLEFSLLDYTQTGRNTYAVWMDKLDDSWSNVGTRHSLSYNNLAPGNYTLQVKGWSNDGVEGVPAIIKFTILPPWWKTFWAYSAYLLLLLSILLLISRFFIQRIRLRNQLQIEKIKRQQSDEMINFKLKFYTNVSHEIRTPLTLISGPLQRLSDLLDKQSEAGKQLTIMQRNTSRLLGLVEQLLDFRKLQSDKLPFRPVNLDIVSFIKDVLLAFQGEAESKSVQILSDLPEQRMIAGFDPDKMEKILFNLLSNAIKFSHENSDVYLQLVQKEQILSISVSDNGPGISPDKQEQIFERFESEGGVGIGLALTRELVSMHGGHIHNEPNPDGGSRFILEIPYTNYEDAPEQLATSVTSSAAPILRDMQFSLLIVEDNPELRDYIAGIFADHFKVYTAENGKVALISVARHNPDLIISDVMMPQMDGISLCRNIKTQLDTCHIPLVLLTAYSDIKHQLEGSQAGADLYVPKPFNETLLRSNVISILSNRQKIRQKFANSESIDASKLASNPLDENLVGQLSELIEQNLDNPELNVELLASEVGLSRSQLTRKLNSIAGMAPGQFIQNFKLKKAAHLLKTTNLNISEVAYQTGFSDPKYFSRNFKKLFGLTPLEYRK